MDLIDIGIPALGLQFEEKFVVMAKIRESILEMMEIPNRVMAVAQVVSLKQDIAVVEEVQLKLTLVKKFEEITLTCKLSNAK